MADVLLDPGGLVVPVDSLTIERAKSTAHAVGHGHLEYARLVECRRRDGGKEEIVVLEVDVQRPQKRVHDVRATEPLAIVFFADDRRPDVLSLRGDFPQVPHLNLSSTERPKGLCLYEQDWTELKPTWTPPRFVERIRFWLAETARGTLHQEDQPLEPIIVGCGYQIIVPHDLFTRAETVDVQTLAIRLAGDDEKGRILIASRRTRAEHAGAPFVAVVVRAEPQTHGVIRRAPATLHELHQFLAAAGCDLLAKLRGSENLWANKATLNARLVVVAACPKRRGRTTGAEAADVWTFLTLKTVADVLAAIGRRARDGGLILGTRETEQGQTIPVEVVRTTFSFSRDVAAYLNGQDETTKSKVVAIGLGALGSKLQLSLARCGFGEWTLVDEDVLLPHNMARHQYASVWLGHNKARIARLVTASLFEEEPFPEAICANVLDPRGEAERLAKALEEADIVLDMSASVTVARHVAAAKSVARRISVFFNPAGTELVVLAEDNDRAVTLDALEFQLYRGVLSRRELENHLSAGIGRMRYAASCRDITSRVPDDHVSLLAAIGARAVKTAVAGPAALIKVWKLDPSTFTVSAVDVPVSATRTEAHGGWTVIVDETLDEKLLALREAKLPNETGGVLLGFFDHDKRRAYVIDTIPSPPDSKEWPTLYIRGSDMLKEDLDRVTRLTGGNVEYVGEWHSHPRGCSCRPSNDDANVFAWLTKHMADEGQPALMAIVGDRGPRIFLAQMVWKDE